MRECLEFAVVIIPVLLVILAPGLAAAQEGTRTVRAFVHCGDAFEIPAKDHPTRILGDLDGFDPPQSVPLSRYGGWKTKRLEATGYFRVQKMENRWWMVDPEGYPFLTMGVNAVSPGSSERMRQALKEKFGTSEKWRDHTLRWLKELGFNGTGCWCRDELLVKAPDDLRLSYTPTLNFMGEYGDQRGGTYTLPGHRGYPNDCIFVFEPEFKEFAHEYASRLADRAEDPFLLGYFTDNELPFPDDSLDKFLELPEENPGYQTARSWLEERQGGSADTSAITDQDREEWRAHVIGRYLSIVTEAIHEYDPNHLVLGPRFYGPEKQSRRAWEVAGEYLDLIAVNDYCVWTPSTEKLQKWVQWAGSPVMVTEWYAKGEDSGLPNLTGAGWTVPTQRDRGWFYQNFTLALLESRVCVGWHWFKYADNDPQDDSADPSNLNSNKGMVTIRYEPYEPLAEAMDELNHAAYPLTRYFDREK